MRTPRVSRIPLDAAVNVTPMIDVMLVLLITCMIVTPLVTSPAALPRSAHTEPRPEGPDDIVLVIDRHGAHYLSATGETATAELRTVRAVGTDAVYHPLAPLPLLGSATPIHPAGPRMMALISPLQSLRGVTRCPMASSAATTSGRRPPGSYRITSGRA